MRFLVEAGQWLFTVVILKIIVAHWIANQIKKRSSTFSGIMERCKAIYEEELHKVRSSV